MPLQSPRHTPRTRRPRPRSATARQSNASKHPPKALFWVACLINHSSAPHQLLINSSSAPHQPLINPSSTPHQPLINSSSTPHQLLINPSSAPHQPLINPSSAPHQLLINSSSTPHQPLISPSSTPHQPLINPSRRRDPAPKPWPSRRCDTRANATAQMPKCHDDPLITRWGGHNACETFVPRRVEAL